MPNWPHAPIHLFSEKGTAYIVTAGTYQKIHHFNTNDRLEFLQDNLLKLSENFNWKLLSWAIFANHYHFIGKPQKTAENLPDFISNLHTISARYVNENDGTPNRKIWWQYWDSALTHHYSYLARLNYVNQNAVRHGLVGLATDYPWCSASWFERTAPTAFKKAVFSFKIDKVNVLDDF